MFKFNLAKPKKVFERLNKMDRKQAYTLGAIAVVVVVALLMLVSALDSQDDSFAGMNSRGYDLAQMPFVNDEAERVLLAAKYPDMRENGSTLLYSAAEKEARQEADEEAAEQDAAQDEGAESAASEETSSDASYAKGYAGYNGRGGGGGKTEIGSLKSGGMASAGGSGIGSFYGPSLDNRGLQGQKGTVAPAQAQRNARDEIARMRGANFAAARLKDNKMANARKAMQDGSIYGANAFKDGVLVDPNKLGGLELDTSAPPSTSDLSNLDNQVKDAAQKAQDKPKDEDKREWWEDMLIDLAKQAASSLVGSIMDGVGDTIKGQINGNRASRNARNEYGSSMAGKSWNADGKCTGSCLTQEQTQELINNGVTQDQWTKASSKQQRKYGRDTATAWNKGKEAKSIQIGNAVGTTDSSRYHNENSSNPCERVNCPEGYEHNVVGNTCNCKKKS